MTRFALITLNVLFLTALVLPAQNAALTLAGAPLVDGVYQTEPGTPVELYAEFSDDTLEFAIFASLSTDEGGMDWSQAGILLDGAWDRRTIVLGTTIPKQLAGLSICLVAVAQGIDGDTSESREMRIKVAAPYTPPPADQQAVTAYSPDSDLDADGLCDEESFDRKAPVAARPAPRPAEPTSLERRRPQHRDPRR